MNQKLSIWKVLGLLAVVTLLASSMVGCTGPAPTAAPKATESPTQTHKATEAPTQAPKATEPPTEAPAALDGAALLQERCTKCHDLKRVESAQKTEEQWRTTVERMVGKGAQLSADEQAALIKYLAATYK
jgi:cytochrome c5